MHGYIVNKLPDEPVHGSTAVMLLGHNKYVLQICMGGVNSSVCILSCMWDVPQKYVPHVNIGTPMVVHVLHKLLYSGLLT